MQKAEQGVQQVADDCPELLGGGNMNEPLRVPSFGQTLPAGPQRHPQPLDGVVGQVKLQLQLDAVLVGGENPLVLFHHLVWFS